jgi:hypothetical protein
MALYKVSRAQQDLVVVDHSLVVMVLQVAQRLVAMLMSVLKIQITAMQTLPAQIHLEVFLVLVTVATLATGPPVPRLIVVNR